MLKNLLASLFVLCESCLFSATCSLDLPFYKETEHYQIYCLEKDYSAANSMAENLEQYWMKWNQEIFSVSESEKIKLNIFPDIESFHQTELNRSPAPDWFVCSHENDFISIVSPSNPGPVHSEESILKCGKVALGSYFMFQKYGEKPRWILLGLPYYEAQMYSKEHVCQYLLNKNFEIEIPSLDLLENLDGYSWDRSSKIACYLLTDYLVDHWGLEKALDLLNDYSSFEKILEISKEEFRIMCTQYFQTQFIDAQLPKSTERDSKVENSARRRLEFEPGRADTEATQLE